MEAGEKQKSGSYLQELTLPQYQLMTVRSVDRQHNMGGCRFKDYFYMAVILLLGLVLWISYTKSSSHAEESYPWADGDGDQSAQSLLHYGGRGINDYHAADDGDDDDGFLHDDHIQDEDEDDDDDDDDYDEEEDDDDDDDDEDSPHLPLQEDIVGSDSSVQTYPSMSAGIIGLTEDKGSSAEHQVPPEQYSPQIALSSDTNVQSNDLKEPVYLPPGIPDGLNMFPETGLLAQPVQSDGSLQNTENTEPEPEPSSINAAQQILINHADRAEQLHLLNNLMPGRPETPDSNEPSFEHNDKPKPRIVLRSTKEDVAGDQPKIPRIIHQSWETTDVPVNFAGWIRTWLKQNPGWEYWFWTPEDIRKLLENSYPRFLATYDSPSASLEDRANIMRYFIIHAHGGVYAELDMECLNSMDTWIFSHGCFLVEDTREHSYLLDNKLEGNVINALMACKPHHPFYDVIIHALPDYLSRYPGDSQKSSGSFFLDEMYRAFKKHPLPSSLSTYGDVALIEPDYFIPSYNQKHWAAIDKACNTNIASMPFHVSWLCTLWIRKRMHENQPYKHSYTDHHWIDAEDIGVDNINTVPIISIIQEVTGGSQSEQETSDQKEQSIIPKYPDMGISDAANQFPIQNKLSNLPNDQVMQDNNPELSQHDSNIKNIPEYPRLPSQNELPKLPDRPQMPETPMALGQGNLPAFPQIPGVPKLPDMQNPTSQEIPKLPEFPQIPEIPKMPETPMAGSQQYPSNNILPQLPETPLSGLQQNNILPQLPEAPLAASQQSNVLPQLPQAPMSGSQSNVLPQLPQAPMSGSQSNVLPQLPQAPMAGSQNNILPHLPEAPLPGSQQDNVLPQFPGSPMSGTQQNPLNNIPPQLPSNILNDQHHPDTLISNYVPGSPEKTVSQNSMYPQTPQGVGTNQLPSGIHQPAIPQEQQAQRINLPQLPQESSMKAQQAASAYLPPIPGGSQSVSSGSQQIGDPLRNTNQLPFSNPELSNSQNRVPYIQGNAPGAPGYGALPPVPQNQPPPI